MCGFGCPQLVFIVIGEGGGGVGTIGEISTTL